MEDRRRVALLICCFAGNRLSCLGYRSIVFCDMLTLTEPPHSPVGDFSCPYGLSKGLYILAFNRSYPLDVLLQPGHDRRKPKVVSVLRDPATLHLPNLLTLKSTVYAEHFPPCSDGEFHPFALHQQSMSQKLAA